MSNQFLDSNCTDEFIEQTKHCYNSLAAASIFDVRFWSDFAIAPTHDFPYSFCQSQRQLDHIFTIMKAFKPNPEDYRSVKEFCDIAQKIYDVVLLIRN